MTVRDDCFILHRFRSGDDSLTLRAYCRELGNRSVFVPEYFDLKRFKLGVFEPFNVISLYLTERNGVLSAEDTLGVLNFSREAAFNFEKFLYLSKISETVLRFVRFADEEIFKLLLTAATIRDFFNFNLVRFWLNLANILGFSLQKLNRAGWVNVYDLGICKEEEIGKGYCVFVPPRVLSLLKRISESGTKPFNPRGDEMEKLERFFKRYFSLQVENF